MKAYWILEIEGQKTKKTSKPIESYFLYFEAQRLKVQGKKVKLTRTDTVTRQLRIV